MLLVRLRMLYTYIFIIIKVICDVLLYNNNILCYLKVSYVFL